MILAQHWECQHSLCTAWATTYNTQVPHHPCRYTGGLLTPLVRVNSTDHIRLVEREDYIGGETVTAWHDRTPVQAVQRVRDDGVDCSVFAPTATASTDDREATP